ncbi:MAG: hypothetical protein HGB11_09885, partial [Chlorobiales bacterium]|nr:hypothetical protein [Chlorobiales bacterium]
MKRVVKVIAIWLIGMFATIGLCVPSYAVEQPNEQICKGAVAESLDTTFLMYNQLLMKIQYKQQKVDMLKAQLWKTIGDIKTYNEVCSDLREDVMPDMKTLSAYADARRDYEFAVKELESYKKMLVQVEAAYEVQQKEYVRLSA